MFMTPNYEGVAAGMSAKKQVFQRAEWQGGGCERKPKNMFLFSLHNVLASGHRGGCWCVALVHPSPLALEQIELVLFKNNINRTSPQWVTVLLPKWAGAEESKKTKGKKKKNTTGASFIIAFGWRSNRTPGGAFTRTKIELKIASIGWIQFKPTLLHCDVQYILQCYPILLNVMVSPP